MAHLRVAFQHQSLCEHYFVRFVRELLEFLTYRLVWWKCKLSIGQNLQGHYLRSDFFHITASGYDQS